MEETTKIFDRLPPQEGVPFSGLENVQIQSRLVIEEQIKDYIAYCKNEAERVSASFILGDWGEGKTDTYERLIKPEINSSGDYLFFLSASRLVNSFNNESIMNFAKFSLLQDERLLIHIFNALKDRSDYKDFLPEFSKNPKFFIKNVLDSLLDKNDKKIFIFIDEFEELLLEPRILKKVISGIKEAINGEFEPLSQNGEYKGRLHFFVSCTPDAYFKIQVNDDIGLLQGSFDRRVRKIRLTQINNNEGLYYLLNLLNYSYEDKLPQKLPITDFSLFNTMLRVSQRNMGNLTSLFAKIFNSLRVDEHNMRLLNYDNLIYLLKENEITAFGGQTPCIDANYDRILNYLADQPNTNDGILCKEIFKLLTGELRPITQLEILKILSNQNIPVQKLINTINKDIKEKEKIDHSFIKVASLKSEIGYQDLLSILADQEYVKNDYKTFNISSVNYSLPIEEFKEKIVYYELNEDLNLSEKLYLPIDPTNCKSFFEELGDDGASEISEVFQNLITEDFAYLASESILNMVYPTPIPLDLGYFNNEELKLKIWREVSHNLNDEFDKNILDAFNLFLNESKMFEIDDSELLETETQTPIKTKFLVVNGDVKLQDITDANNILTNDYATNLVIILYNGEMTKKAIEALSNKKLGRDDKYQVLAIHLHHAIAKKLLFGIKAHKKYSKYVENDLFQGVCREKVEEINLKNKINDWFVHQEKRGLLINQIRLKKSPNAKVFADGLKLYLNYSGSHTPEEIYRLNVDGIFKFKKYGAKGFIASDYEDAPSQIIKASSDLEINGFLKKDDDKYEVITNPVETQITEFVKNKEKVSLNDLKSYFIIRDRNERAFQDVFINILKYKGIINEIKEKNLFYELTDRTIALDKLKELYGAYQDNIKQDKFREFGHFYVRKKKSSNLILIDEFDEFINELYNEAVSTNDILKINICSKVLTHYDENIKTAILAAEENSLNITDSVDDIKLDLDKSLERLSNKGHTWKLSFDNEDIAEYKGLLSDLNEYKELYDKEFLKDDLEKEIKNIESKLKIKYPEDYIEKEMEIFGFRKDNTIKPYFNIKFYLLNEKKNKIVKKSSEIKNKIERIETKFDEISQRQNELDKRLEDIRDKISNQNKLSYFMYKLLENAQYTSKLPVKHFSGDLTSLIQSSETSIRAIGDNISLVIKYTDYIEQLTKVEVEFLENLADVKSKYSIFKEVCDINIFEKMLDRLNNKIKDLKASYEDIDLEELNTNLTKRKGLLDDLKEWSRDLKLKSEAIDANWEDFQDQNKEFIDNIQTTLSILESKGDIDEDDLSEIQNFIHKLKNDTKIDLLDADFTAYAEMESKKEKLNKLASELFEKHLKGNLKELVIALESMKSEWIDYNDIKTYASQELDMDEGCLQEALEKLIEKGYLHRGFSLTF